MNKMNKKSKTRLFLIISLVVMITFFVGVMSVFSVTVGEKNNDVISKMGNVYTSGMSEEIAMHFETIINLQIDKAATILSSIPDDSARYGEEMIKALEKEGREHGYDYFSLMDSEGNFEVIYGEDLVIIDPEPFITSMNNGDKKVAIAKRTSDQDNINSGDIIALGISSSYPMKDGKRSTAMVIGIPVSDLSLPLSLSMDNSILVYSHVIRIDGSFIIRSEEISENNYFDRMRNAYHDVDGGDIEDYISILRSHMEKNEDFFQNFYMNSDGEAVNYKNEKCALFCTRLTNSEWYLITVMPYGSINEIIEESNSYQQRMYAVTVSIMLVVIIVIFILYFKMTWNQMTEMETARKEAVKANKAKSEFLSNMSHDIRTPMNAIVGMTAIAVTHLDDRQQVQTCLKKISLSSKHLLGLINDILDMSKIESGKMTLNMDMISLREVMDSIISIVQPQIKAKNQNFEVSIYDIKCENVYCDSVRLNQVILNLMSNAIKFTHDGGDIRTVLYQEDSDKGENYIRVHFIVKDNGIGMSPEFKEKIFESFMREDNKRVHHTEGSGLGMSITKYIIDAMGGSIEVESEQGKGSEFRITIDMEKATESEEEMILPKWRILVVDDDNLLCESAVNSLKEIGVDADWCLNAEKALEMVSENNRKHTPYEIILIDWKLPGMDGIEATKLIRKEMNNNIPIILISAYDWSDIEENAKKAGVTGFISKPLFKSTLYHGLRQFSGGKLQEESKEKTEEHKLTHMKVLLAEDNDLNWEIANELLTPLGLDMDHAENGKICLEMFEKSPVGYYSAILMDIRMPVMSGLEATEEIRKLDRSDAGVPIIAMTADAFTEDRQKCLNAGMNAHIAKPIDVKEVERMLEKFVGTK